MEAAQRTCTPKTAASALPRRQMLIPDTFHSVDRLNDSITAFNRYIKKIIYDLCLLFYGELEICHILPTVLETLSIESNAKT